MPRCSPAANERGRNPLSLGWPLHRDRFDLGLGQGQYRGMARNALDSAQPARVPLYRTIADAIIRDIRRGRHLEGERLPASRDLARALEVNRATVHQALQLLKREGWIETNKGGGTRVARRSSAVPVLGPAPAWDRIASSLLTRILSEPPAASRSRCHTTFRASRRTSGTSRRPPSRRFSPTWRATARSSRMAPRSATARSARPSPSAWPNAASRPTRTRSSS